MKEFEVTVTETLQKSLTVEATSKEEAERLVEDMWKSGDVVLDADHFVGAEFTSNDGVEKQAEKTMDVLVVEPGQYPKMMTIGTNLEAMQKAVGGDIQAIYPYEEPVALVCDEEAKLTGKPLNRALRDEDGNIYDIVAGTFFICGLTEDDFGSLPKELQKKFEEKFKKPETFLKMGRSIMAIPTEPAKAAAKPEKKAPGMEL